VDQIWIYYTQRVINPNLVIVIEIQGAQWLETATCERGFSLRTQILTVQRYSMGDSLLACLIMIVSNDLSLDQKEEEVKCFLADLRLESLKSEKKNLCAICLPWQIAHKFESGWEVGVIKAFDKNNPHAGKFSVKYMDHSNLPTHSLFREVYGKDKPWVLLRLLSRDSVTTTLAAGGPSLFFVVFIEVTYDCSEVCY
jgi:hypothetical protein